MKVAFTNLGCKLNQAELERIARDFAAAGHTVVGSVEVADLHVINTCTVTHVAARTSRKAARRSKRRNEGVRTVLTGCWVASDPAEAAALAGVDLVVPNPDKERLVPIVLEAFGIEPVAEETSADAMDRAFPSIEFGNTRAAVKIEDGCNVGCAFCVIPSTRGRQRSRPVPEIVTEVRSLAELGVAEVVVTGVQISHYRWQGLDLVDLTRRVLDETSIERIRLTSIAPWRFDPRLVDLMSTGRVCRHVHMSLQSGCDATLSRMRRPYTVDTYRAAVETLRAGVPGIAITTDVIVGFPGETDTEIADSLRFVERMGFAKIHAFPFSPRAGTPAAEMPGTIPSKTVRTRMERLLMLASRSESRFLDERVGEREPVLWESEADDGSIRGTTDNYVKVVTADAVGLGSIVPATIVGVSGDQAVGRVEPAAARSRGRDEPSKAAIGA